MVRANIIINLKLFSHGLRFSQNGHAQIINLKLSRTLPAKSGSYHILHFTNTSSVVICMPLQLPHLLHKIAGSVSTRAGILHSHLVQHQIQNSTSRRESHRDVEFYFVFEQNYHDFDSWVAFFESRRHAELLKCAWLSCVEKVKSCGSTCLWTFIYTSVHVDQNLRCSVQNSKLLLNISTYYFNAHTIRNFKQHWTNWHCIRENWKKLK